MPNYLIPNTALGVGKTRFAKVQSVASLAMGASAAPQTEVDIPNYGDIIAVEVVLTQLTAGTLSASKTIDYSLQQLAIKDRSGKPIWTGVRGIDLSKLDRFLNIGRTRTVPTTLNTATTHRWLIPCNIEQKDQTAKLAVTVSAFSDMATGATGGTVSFDIVVYYQDQSQIAFTQRIMRLTQSIISGVNRVAPILPKDKVIQHLLFSLTTESNITDIDFSADGSSELSGIRLSDLQAIEDVRLISGHVTGEFSLLNSVFAVTDRTILDVNGAGSDTISWYLVIAD